MRRELNLELWPRCRDCAVVIRGQGIVPHTANLMQQPEISTGCQLRLLSRVLSSASSRAPFYLFRDAGAGMGIAATFFLRVAVFLSRCAVFFLHSRLLGFTLISRSGNSTFFQRGSPPPPPWRLLSGRILLFDRIARQECRSGPGTGGFKISDGTNATLKNDLLSLLA